jgi:hypothetical protein
MNAKRDRATWKRSISLCGWSIARRRISSSTSAFGIALVLVAGMSSSGVAATSRANTSAAEKKAVKPAEIGEGVQITRPQTREERVGQQALAMVTYDWRTTLPGWRIQFLPAKKGYLAVTFRVEQRIDVYVRTDRPVEGIAHDIAHEIGHALDVTYLNEATRARYLELRGLPVATDWWACERCRDLKTGAGDFAEVFALHGAPQFRFYSELAPAPKAETLRSIIAEVIPAG